jgi:hypothetical protein
MTPNAKNPPRDPVSTRQNSITPPANINVIHFTHTPQPRARTQIHTNVGAKATTRNPAKAFGYTSDPKTRLLVMRNKKSLGACAAST